jgi:competence protein ComGC
VVVVVVLMVVMLVVVVVVAVVTTENSHIKHSTRTAESANIKVQNMFNMPNKTTSSIN